MEAMILRLDQMDALAASAGLSLNKTTFNSENSFGAVLDKAIAKAENAEKPAEPPAKTEGAAKPAETQPKSESDDAKLKQIVGESDANQSEKAADVPSETEGAQSLAEKAGEKTALLPQDGEAAELALEGDVLGESAEPLAEAVSLGKDELLAKMQEPKARTLPELSEELGLTVTVFSPEEDDGLEAFGAELEPLAAKKGGKKPAGLEGIESVAVLPLAAQGAKVDAAALGEGEGALSAVQGAKNARNQGEPLIAVIDERTSVPVDAENAKGGNFVSSVAYDGNGNAEMTLNLANSDMSGIIGMADGSQSVEASPHTFSTMLSAEIRSNASELVKNGLITLRDNNSGTISLVLHPEELGNVKIKLELSDKLITGKIIVNSEEAFGAFKNNIESLRQAFISSGFENAGLELSLAGGDADKGGAKQQEERRQSPQALAFAEAVPLAAGAEDLASSYYGLTSVDMFV